MNTNFKQLFYGPNVESPYELFGQRQTGRTERMLDVACAHVGKVVIVAANYQSVQDIQGRLKTRDRPDISVVAAYLAREFMSGQRVDYLAVDHHAVECALAELFGGGR